MTGWGAVYGLAFGVVLLAARPVRGHASGRPPAAGGPADRSDPAAGRGRGVRPGRVLIGAGDQNYLALVALAAGAVFGVAATCVHALHGGLVALWLAYSLWLAARFITLTLRAHGTAWLVTGAVRR